MPSMYERMDAAETAIADLLFKIEGMEAEQHGHYAEYHKGVREAVVSLDHQVLELRAHAQVLSNLTTELFQIMKILSEKIQKLEGEISGNC